MFAYLRACASLLLVMTLLLGIAYPLLLLAVGQGIMPGKANGSLLEKNGKVVGSALLGQSFTAPKYFWSRPSATSPAYNASASSGSNLSPINSKLLEAVTERRKSLINTAHKAPLPVDMVTYSASGLDPHISYDAALMQAERVARARGKKAADVQAAIEAQAEGGLLGPKRVNVLLLNMALDEVK